jgi:hypothetical protein
VAAGANPLIVITDPSDPETVVQSLLLHYKIRLLHLLMQLLSIGSPIVTVVVAVQSPSAFPLAAVATTSMYPFRRQKRNGLSTY